MNTVVLDFTPRAELSSLVNLKAFVKLCRCSEVLNAKEQFDKNIWNLGYLKGHNKAHRAVFSTLEASSKNKSEPVLPHPFLDFAKAILVYLHDKRPLVSHSVRISALRCLEAALRESSKGSRPTAVDEVVLDSAVELAKKQVSPTVAYRIAGQLEYIAKFMLSKGFISLRQYWTHGVKKPQELGSRISKEALTARQEKLPSAATLHALAGIFCKAVNPVDIIVSSNMCLMLCAPERINEVLRLRRNCIVQGDGEYRERLGVRWPGSKGFEDTIKWIPSEMVSIAQKAISNILQVTATAQKLAAWYTMNPKKLYLHEEASYLRDTKVLTSEDIGLIIWGDRSAKKRASTWAKVTNKLPQQQINGSQIGFLFKDVERAVLEMLPETFPYMPGAPELFCHDSMAIMKTNELHSGRPTYLCMFSCVDYGAITSHLGTHRNQMSIFERFGYVEDDDTPIKIRSHNLRHYLNMLAQTGGLSSIEIAIFSGRKDVKQNRTYDHMTANEVQAPIHRALKGGFTSELELAASVGRNLVTRAEFKKLGLTAAHTTEYGWCAHDFASEPCQVYRDCINCEEQECIKGEEQKEVNLNQLKSETECLLKRAREALSEEAYGADTWVKHQIGTLKRVDALLSILRDPAVPIGSRIRLGEANVPLVTVNDVSTVKIIKATRRKALA
jgi:hypothetical protein